MRIVVLLTFLFALLLFLFDGIQAGFGEKRNRLGLLVPRAQGFPLDVHPVDRFVVTGFWFSWETGSLEVVQHGDRMVGMATRV